MMADDHRANLKERIDNNERRIGEMNAFRDDPKIDKIIRIFQRQIVRDLFELARLDDGIFFS